MNDSFDLERFISAQSPAYNQVLAELRAGRKRSHWMWFVFPQLKGLGRSATAQHYGIGSLDEARAYLDHPILGPRLRECTQAVNEHPDLSADHIFGFPDNLKFHSCMTLFAVVTEESDVFHEALRIFFRGRGDAKTLKLLAAQNP